jgi:hypothetical protein
MDDSSWLQLLIILAVVEPLPKLWFMLNPDPLLWHLFQCLNLFFFIYKKKKGNSRHPF